MKILILYDDVDTYASQISQEIIDDINSDFIRAFPVKKAKDTCLLKYDFIVLGSSIKRGKIPGPMKRYVERNKATIKGKNIGLFISCFNKEKVDKYLYKSYSKTIVESARFSQYFIEKNSSRFKILRKNEEEIDEETINKFNQKRKEELVDNINQIIEKFEK